MLPRLPMDVEGEASRLLANFYLQEHDSTLSTYIEGELWGNFLRYADEYDSLGPQAQDAR